LFFGWFREVELIDGIYKYSKKDKTGRHIIYGYLEVESVEQINSTSFKEWMKYHPHIMRGKSDRDNYFQSAAKGQEFVIKCTKEIENWVKDLFLTQDISYTSCVILIMNKNEIDEHNTLGLEFDEQVNFDSVFECFDKATSF
jgi:hypothetical protein